MSRALVLVDVQQGFITEQTRHIVPRLVELLDQFAGEPVVRTPPA